MRTSLTVGFDAEGKPTVLCCVDDYAQCLDAAEDAAKSGKYPVIHCYRSPEFDRRFFAAPVESAESSGPDEPEKRKPGRPKSS